MSIFVVLSLFLLFVSFDRLARFSSSIAFLEKEALYLEDAKDFSEEDFDSIKIHILVPVLEEVNVIEENVKRFTSLTGEYTLSYITTERENISNKEGVNYTKLILEKLQDKKKSFNIIHYPRADGVMSHQLNFALEQLEVNGKLGDRDYILVYNADSLVHRNIIDDLKKFLCLKNFPNIVHQPAVFFKNYSIFESGFVGSLLKNIALLQSRWTLVHEIPRIRRSASTGIFRFFESGHLVGHGMLISSTTLKEIGGFFTQYRNEDLPMGYVLGNRGEKIQVFPILENAESPRTLWQIIRQYTSWYYGASGYLSYLHDYLKSPQRRNMFRAVVTATHNQIRGTSWALSGVFWLGIIIWSSAVGQHHHSVFFFLMFCIQHPLLYILMAHFLNQSKQQNIQATSKKIDVSLVQIVTSLLSYIFHTIGPLRAIWQMTFSLATNKQYSKEKTER